MENTKTNTEPAAFIFIGRSGCGKGTQVELFKKELSEKSPLKTIHVETGSLLRDFTKNNKSYSAEITGGVIYTGGLMPEAMVVYLWMKHLIENFTGKENMIFDGAPRKITEAILLDGALKFYDIKKYNVIYMNVSRQWATDRLLGRQRKDDNTDAINKRMDWFENDVMQSVDFFKADQHCKFIEIDGEKTVEEVHKEIMDKVEI